MSAFPFENHLGMLKKYVRKAQNPLSQLAKRIDELENCSVQRNKKHIKTRISTKKKDRWFYLKEDKVACIDKVVDNGFECRIFKLSNLDSFFSNPCCSKLLNIFYLHSNAHFKRCLIQKDVMTRKVCAISYNNGYVLVPLHHDVNF